MSYMMCVYINIHLTYSKDQSTFNVLQFPHIGLKLFISKLLKHLLSISNLPSWNLPTGFDRIYPDGLRQSPVH